MLLRHAVKGPTQVGEFDKLVTAYREGENKRNAEQERQKELRRKERQIAKEEKAAKREQSLIERQQALKQKRAEQEEAKHRIAETSQRQVSPVATQPPDRPATIQGEVVYPSCQSAATVQSTQVTVNVQQQSRPNEQVLFTAHKSMVRNSPVGFLIVIVLCFVGIGVPILLSWWLQCIGTTLTITNTRTTLRHGILSKTITAVRHKDIRNVQISQSFLQRVFDVGTIGIATAGHAGVEILVSGIPYPG